LLIFRTGVSCFSVTLFYSTLLALTHKQNDWWRLKYTCCAWAGGTFFPVVLLCQFLVMVVTYLCTLSTIQLWCCVSFWFWREIVFGVMYLFSVQYSCEVVSVFWLWWEIVLKMRTPFYKKSYCVTCLWSASRCLFFIRPNTLLLCIFLFCINLLYRTDPQVEAQIRKLLNNKYKIVSIMEHWQSHFDSLKMTIQFLCLKKNLLAKIYFL
jgi:hypothetical protein